MQARDGVQQGEAARGRDIGPDRPRRTRDARIDALRGLALITIFIDHVPANPLTFATMRNFGFADAAELFVILAGVSSMTAYGAAFERIGAGAGVRRVLARCLRLYVVQVGLLLTTLAIVHQWRAHLGLEPQTIDAFFERPLAAIGHALALHALPASLDILPLYIVLLGAFPLIYAGVRFLPWATLLLSAALWGAVNLDRTINLTNWLDGQGWFFNPFAWQFLFTLGVFGAVILRANGGGLPRRRSLVIACWTYLVGSCVIAAPWTVWGLAAWHPFAFEPADKTGLDPRRLLHILAVVYLVLSSPAFRQLAAAPSLSWLARCGRHSLEVFALGTLLALVFRLLFETFGPSALLKILVNVVGVGALVLLAFVLERRKARLAATLARADQRMTEIAPCAGVPLAAWPALSSPPAPSARARP
jgi:hypothetical protein